MRSRRNSVTYLGIDDWWLKSGQRQRGKHVRPIEQQMIEMGQQERQHFDLASDLVKDVRALVGERSFNLLTSGRKLEVEGLMTVSPRFMAFSPRLLLARIRRFL
jgi:hypothetical protein